MSEPALQINVLTLGGTCNCHIWFHSLLSCLAEECSTYSSCLMRSATRYANLTENMTFLFSFQISLSRLAVVPKLMCCISHTVLGMNVLESNCRCHYLVAGLKRSHTLMFLSASGLSCGGVWEPPMVINFDAPAISHFPHCGCSYQVPCLQQASPHK